MDREINGELIEYANGFDLPEISVDVHAIDL